MLFLFACALAPDAGEKPDPAVADDCTAAPWYADADGDGHGATLAEIACTAPAGAVAAAGDCDDADPAVFPGAAEVCDGADQDCDDLVDEDLPVVEVWDDADGDGYGDPATAALRCDSAGTVDNGADCDDWEADTHPGAAEVCDGEDDDCDGLVDDADPDAVLPTWYWDYDGDGYGASGSPALACHAPADHVALDGDCEPSDATVNPGEAEVCLDGVDQDCDGRTDDYTGACWPRPEGEISGDLCDAVEPADAAFCAPGVAAVLPTGGVYGTVQDALDAAFPGDTVTVCPGLWTESLTVPTSPLALVGYGAGVSVLTSAGRILDIGTGNAVTIADLTFEGGTVVDWGAAVYGEEAELCVARTAFAFGNAMDGGAIHLVGTGSLSLDETVFFDNFAGYSAGAVGLLGYWEPIPFHVEDSVFQDNTSGYESGAFDSSGPNDGTITNVTFRGNYAGNIGGAMEFGGDELDTATLTLDGVVFDGNAAGYHGGALSLGTWDSFDATATSCTFTNNDAGLEGGAVLVGSHGDNTFTASDSTFSGNTAVLGGALYVGGWGDATLSLDRCTLEGNTSTYDGGAVYMGGNGVETVTLTECTVHANTARYYGGVGIPEDGTLYSYDTDWGTGGTDNAPDDVGGYTWPGAATFTCTADACN